MLGIAGVDLPNKKENGICFNVYLRDGLHNSRLILDAVGIDYNKRAYELTEDEAAIIRKRDPR